MVNRKKIIILFLVLFGGAGLIAFFLIRDRMWHEDLNTSMYHYYDTKKLVKFAYEAAVKLEREGMAGLEHFKKNREKYRTKDFYLYVYDLDGNNLFHAGIEQLEGRNLRNAQDKQGKRILDHVFGALNDENNSHGWVHYLWWEPGKFFPVPKSSCHFKVKTPEGRELFVGAGLDYPHEEKEFVRIIVDAAVQLLKDKGEKAFEVIESPISPYNYRDVRVFIFDSKGDTIISPVSADLSSSLKLLDCVDEVGHKPFKKALKELESKDRVWEIFMTKNRYRRKLTKKCLYLRKVTVAGRIYYVGAVTDMPLPI